jgi:hypothetical protein
MYTFYMYMDTDDYLFILTGAFPKVTRRVYLPLFYSDNRSGTPIYIKNQKIVVHLRLSAN